MLTKVDQMTGMHTGVPQGQLVCSKALRDSIGIFSVRHSCSVGYLFLLELFFIRVIHWILCECFAYMCVCTLHACLLSMEVVRYHVSNGS